MVGGVKVYYAVLLALVLGVGCGQDVLVGIPVVVHPAYTTPYYYPVLPGPPFTRIQLRQPGRTASTN